VKGDGGAIGLTDNSAELVQWMVFHPDVARLILDFDCHRHRCVPRARRELWIALGIGKNFRYIAVNDICDSLGLEKSPTPVFHAFAGSDQISFFAVRGKDIAWEAWKMYEEDTSAFIALTDKPKSALEESMPALI
jgi:hypothetical protein